MAFVVLSLKLKLLIQFECNYSEHLDERGCMGRHDFEHSAFSTDEFIGLSCAVFPAAAANSFEFVEEIFTSSPSLQVVSPLIWLHSGKL